ncbi:MAG: transglycosylase domain-containing protein [Chloroflexota bacterium]|nr:transglycosylase domain-containing protein [Chloroflexota bacterium]
MTTATKIIWRRHRRGARRQAAATSRTIVSILLALAVLLVVVLPVTVIAANTLIFYFETLSAAPLSREGAAREAGGRATELYDSTGETLLYSLRTVSGDAMAWVDLDTLPPFLIAATLQAEDADFLTRPPRDAADMMATLWENWLVGTLTPDRTITGRLVREVIAPTADGALDLNATRARETVLVAELERRYSLADILEWHLNTNFYGNEAYGVESAAQLYFGKRAVDLALDEAAMLAAIPSAPQYNPFSSEIAARGRQGDVLRGLLNADVIDQAAHDDAAARLTPIVRDNYLPPIAPEFTVYARQQAATVLDSLGYDGTRLVALGGLHITTTLDLALYRDLECLRDASLRRLNGQPTPTECPPAARLPDAGTALDGLPPDSAALLVLDARTGAIAAMVGGATGVEHAPGVMLQPFVYLNGLLRGVNTPASMVFDIPNQFPGAQQGLIYTFTNPQQPFSGAMNLRGAMGSWRLPPAVDIAYRQGMPAILTTAHSLGVNSLEEARSDVMLLERGGAVSLLDIGYAFSVFATLGDMRGVEVPPIARGYRARDPVAVITIADADGTVLWRYDAEDARACTSLDVCTPLLEPGAAYLINDMLADQETRWSLYGQNSPFDTTMPAAIVAGVAGDGERQWTVGYSADYVVGAVMYRADGQPVGLAADTVTAAAAPWNALIEHVHALRGTGTSWERPPSVIEAVVCQISGLLPNDACPVVSELFLDGTQPGTVDSFWQVVEVNDQSGRLANFNTPPELRRQARFFVPPTGAPMEWWVANQQPLPPTEYDDVSRPQIFETVRIDRPALFDYIGGRADIYAEIDPDGVAYVLLEYGEGLNPTQWLTIGGQQTTFDSRRPLGTWDTSALDGLYSLRLIAVMDDQSRESDAVQVTIDNQPPIARLDSLEPGKIYRWPSDDVILLNAEIADNLKIDRAEFYYGDSLLGADVSWPHGIEWQITGLGSHTFTVIAFDAVGNQASSTVTVEVLRSGT